MNLRFNLPTDANYPYDNEKIYLQADENNQFTIEDYHLPIGVGSCRLLNDSDDIVGNINRTDSEMIINLFTEHKCNIYISVEIEKVSIHAIGDICVDSPMNVNTLVLMANNIMLFGNITCEQLICLAENSLVFQEGTIEVANHLKVTSPRVVQHAQVISYSTTEISTSDFYTSAHSKSILNLNSSNDGVTLVLNSFGCITLESDSELMLSNGCISYNKLTTNGLLNLSSINVEHLPESSFTMFGVDSVLTIKDSQLYHTDFDISDGEVNITNAEFISKNITFKPVKADMCNHQMTAASIDLDGECYFKENSLLKFTKILKVSGYISLDNAGCVFQGRSAIEPSLVSIDGWFVSHASNISVENILIEADGFMKITHTDSKVAASLISLTGRGQLTLEEGAVRAENIQHEGALISIDKQGRLSVENDLNCTHDILSEDATESGMFVIENASMKVGNDLIAANILAENSKIDIAYQLTIAETKIAQFKMSELSVNSAVCYGRVDISDSTIMIESLAIYNQFFILGELSNLNVDDHLKIGRAAYVGLRASVNMTADVELNGILTLSNNVSFTTTQDFLIGLKAALYISGGTLKAQRICQQGQIIVEATHLKSDQNKSKSICSKIIAASEFISESNSSIKGCQGDENTSAQLMVSASVSRIAGKIIMPYMKLKGDRYISQGGEINVVHFILKMNYVGENNSSIRTDFLELYMPMWQNNASVIVSKNLFSRTLIEESGSLRVANRDSKTLLSVELNTSSTPSISLSKIADPKKILAYVFGLIAPASLVTAYQSVVLAYSLITTLCDGGSEIYRKLTKRYVKEYGEQLNSNISAVITHGITHMQYHEALRLFWGAQQTTSNVRDIYKNIEPIKVHAQQALDCMLDLKGTAEKLKTSTLASLSATKKYVSDKLQDIDQQVLTSNQIAAAAATSSDSTKNAAQSLMAEAENTPTPVPEFSSVSTSESHAHSKTAPVAEDVPTETSLTDSAPAPGLPSRLSCQYLQAAWSELLPEKTRAAFALSLGKSTLDHLTAYVGTTLPMQTVSSLMALKLFNVGLNQSSFNILQMNLGFDFSLVQTLETDLLLNCGYVGGWKSTLSSAYFTNRGLVASYQLHLEGETFRQQGIVGSLNDITVLYTHWDNSIGSKVITPKKIIAKGKIFTAEATDLTASDISLDYEKISLNQVRANVKYQISLAGSTRIHDSNLNYGTMIADAGDEGYFERTGSTVCTATGATEPVTVSASASAENQPVGMTPTTQVHAKNIHLGKNTSGDTGNTYYHGDVINDHSHTKFSGATQVLDGKTVEHSGHAEGGTFIIKSQTIPSLTGTTDVDNLGLDCPVLKSEEAAKFISGNGAYNHYHANKFVSVVTKEKVALTQSILKREVGVSVDAKEVVREEHLSSRHPIVLNSQDNCVSTHKIEAPYVKVTSDGALVFETGADIISNNTVVGAGDGNLVIRAKIVGKDSTDIIMKDPDNHEFIVTKQVDFEPHWKSKTPKDKNVLTNHVYYYAAEEGLCYKARDHSGKLHSGKISSLELTSKTKNLLDNAGTLKSKDIDKLHRKLSSAIIVHHDLGQGYITGGPGLLQDGTGLYLDVGRMQLNGPVKLEAQGHVGGKINNVDVVPTVTTIVHKSTKPPKAALQKIANMKRHEKTITHEVAAPSIASHDGAVVFEVKHDVTSTAALFSGKKGVYVTVGGEVYLLSLDVTNLSIKTTDFSWGGYWKKVRKSTQVAHLTKIQSAEGPGFINSDGDQYLMGMRYECQGGGQIKSKKVIYISAPILAVKTLEVGHSIKVYLNGIELGHLFEAYTSTAVALFSNKKIPKEKWLTLFDELCAKEPAIGVLKDCIGSQNIYEKFINGWNTGLTGLELINQLSQGINRQDLAGALAARYNVATPEIKVEFSRSRKKAEFHIVDGDAGIYSGAPLTFDADKLNLANGVMVHAQGLIFKVNIITAKPAELTYSMKENRIGLNAGYNGGWHGGVSAESHHRRGVCHQAPLLVSPWVHFNNVNKVTGTLSIRCDKISGHINKVKQTSIADKHSREDMSASGSTTGSASAYYGKGASKTKGAGFVEWRAKDASELSIGELNSQGASMTLPNAQIDKATGEKVRLYDDYVGIGLSGNLKSDTADKDAASKGSASCDTSGGALFKPVDINLNFSNQRAVQYAVLAEAEVKEIHGNMVTNEADGYRSHGTQINATIIVPLTNAERIQKFSDHVKAAVEKIASAVRTTTVNNHQPTDLDNARVVCDGADEDKDSVDETSAVFVDERDSAIQASAEDAVSISADQENIVPTDFATEDVVLPVAAEGDPDVINDVVAADLAAAEDVIPADTIVASDTAPETTREVAGQDTVESSSDEMFIDAFKTSLEVALEVDQADGPVHHSPEDIAALEEETNRTLAELLLLGVKDGATGLILPGKEDQPLDHQNLSVWERFCLGLGNLVSDMPIILVAGRIVIKLAQLAKLSPQGMAISAAIGAAGFGLPTLIQATRQAYHEYQKQNPDSNFSILEFIDKYGTDIITETAKSAASGAAIGVIGVKLNNGLSKVKFATKAPQILPGENAVMNELNLLGNAINHTGSIATLSTVPDIIHGQTPTPGSIVDNTLLLTFTHGCGMAKNKMRSLILPNEIKTEYPLTNRVTQTNTFAELDNRGQRVFTATFQPAVKSKPGILVEPSYTKIFDLSKINGYLYHDHESWSGIAAKNVKDDSSTACFKFPISPTVLNNSNPPAVTNKLIQDMLFSIQQDRYYPLERRIDLSVGSSCQELNYKLNFHGAIPFYADTGLAAIIAKNAFTILHKFNQNYDFGKPSFNFNIELAKNGELIVGFKNDKTLIEGKNTSGLAFLESIPQQVIVAVYTTHQQVASTLRHEFEHVAMQGIYKNNCNPFKRTDVKSAKKLMTAVMRDEELSRSDNNTQRENRVREILFESYLYYPKKNQISEIPTFLSEAYFFDPAATEKVGPNQVEFMRKIHQDVGLSHWRTPVKYMLEKIFPNAVLTEQQKYLFVDSLMRELQAKGMTDKLFDNQQTNLESKAYRIDLIDCIRAHKWAVRGSKVNILEITKNIADAFEQSQHKKNVVEPTPLESSGLFNTFNKRKFSIINNMYSQENLDNNQLSFSANSGGLLFNAKLDANLSHAIGIRSSACHIINNGLFYATSKLISKHSCYNLGSVPERYRDTFQGLCYKTYELAEDRVFYRAGAEGSPLGQFLSFDKPVSELQARIDKAILPKWPDGGCSIVDSGYAIKIPKGTIVHVGDVARQGGAFLGGTVQIFIEKPWEIPGVEILEKYELKKDIEWNTLPRKN